VAFAGAAGLQHHYLSLFGNGGRHARYSAVKGKPQTVKGITGHLVDVVDCLPPARSGTPA